MRLLSIKGFPPFLIVLILNAMTDIAHKITIQNILIKSYEGSTLIVLSAVVNALILLPFIFLFSPSGFISDRFRKTEVVRWSALAGVVLALLTTLSYYMGWFYAAFSMTFLLAVQSAIYSPAKYGLIRELAGNEKLAEANGMVQAATITAILGSGLLCSAIFELLYDGSGEPSAILESIAPLGWLLVAMTLSELAASFYIIDTKISKPSMKFKIRNYLSFGYLRKNLTLIHGDENIWLSIIGLSIFWGLSQLVVAAFPAHYKAVTGDENTAIIQGLLALSAIGLIIGSVAAGRLSRLHIELGTVPLGSFGIFLSLTLLASSHSVYLIAFASLLFGFFGGMTIVPLNATIQLLSPQTQLGTVLAGNNFIQNIAMTLALLGTIMLVALGFSAGGIFHISGWAVLAATLYSFARLPQLSARLLLLPILRTRYKLFVNGLENLPPRGRRTAAGQPYQLDRLADTSGSISKIHKICNGAEHL